MKTLEALKNKCTAISKQIEQIGLDNNSHFVIDGIIDPEKYLNARYRILWVLKEANSETDSWSYPKKFKNKEWLYRYGKSIPTLRRIIYTTYGILKDCEWSEIPDANNEKSFEPLQEIAIINIKKIPGGSNSNNNEIQKAYYDNQELLKQQIEAYNPNIVIFGNTLQYFFKSDFDGLENTEKQYTEYGNAFHDTGDKLYIHTWHPAARGTKFTDKDYVMDIVNLVRNWR
ncbi:uracil-DNA glycosylase family protein [Bacteroides ihuae]|uniref:hypothetical protein n=1 Tax=Bacteroides ihuae TaxID=1852362 RepID=UPI0008DACD10|nr:hypothetical protein [Bacteroides ihuae]